MKNTQEEPIFLTKIKLTVGVIPLTVSKQNNIFFSIQEFRHIFVIIPEETNN